MLRIFRSIRQRLLAENRFTRYLIYALGEIVLVVAGILIALQINNWNSFANDRKQETKVLSNILDDLLQDKIELESDVEGTKGQINLLDSLISGLTTDIENYSAEQFFKHSRRFVAARKFHNHSGVYKQSISTGDIGLILNDTVRNRIVRYYERDVNMRAADLLMQELLTFHIEPVFFKAIAQTRLFAKATGLDIEFPDINIVELANHPEFVNTIIHKRTKQSRQQMEYKLILQMNQEVISSVEKELSKK